MDVLSKVLLSAQLIAFLREKQCKIRRFSANALPNEQHKSIAEEISALHHEFPTVKAV